VGKWESGKVGKLKVKGERWESGKVGKLKVKG
jgi:hypothetical protein